MRISDWSSDVCSSDLPTILSLERVREIANGAGAALTEKYQHIQWSVDGLTHARKARTVADRLRKMPGIVEAEASAVGAISVEFSRSELTEAEIRKALAQKIGRAQSLNSSHYCATRMPSSPC